MKTVRTFLIFCVLSGPVAGEIAAQSIDFTIRYNSTSDRYEVYGRATSSIGSFNTSGSQITVVLPAIAGDEFLSVINVNGGPWGDATQNYSPAAQPENDFHSISTVGSSISFPAAGTEVLLFTFTLPSCIDGARLFINGSDAGPTEPGMNGEDYSIYFNDGFTGTDYTGITYDNSSSGCSVLPLSLIRFSGQMLQDRVHLAWMTLSESNTSHFDIERSKDAGSWVKIGEVKAAGGSSTQITYTYTDHLEKFEAELVYYRLKMVDEDNRYTYSKIIAFRRYASASHLVLYPNPVSQGDVIRFSKDAISGGNASATIADIHGKMIRAVSAAELNKQAIRTTGMPAGTYFIHFAVNGKKFTGKVIIR